MSNQFLFINGQYYQVINPVNNFINYVPSNYYNSNHNHITNNINYQLINNNNYNENRFAKNTNSDSINQYNSSIEHNHQNNITLNTKKILYSKKRANYLFRNLRNIKALKVVYLII